MGALIELSWRLYPAAALMLAGAWLAVVGMRLERDSVRRPVRDPGKNLTWMRGFRLAVIGLAVAGVGAAWLWHLGWLLALALAIGGEETLESSICIAALRQAPRLEAEHRRRRGADAA